MKITLELFERHDKYKGFHQTSRDQSINYGFFDKLLNHWPDTNQLSTINGMLVTN